MSHKTQERDFNNIIIVLVLDQTKLLHFFLLSFFKFEVYYGGTVVNTARRSRVRLAVLSGVHVLWFSPPTSKHAGRPLVVAADSEFLHGENFKNL